MKSQFAIRIGILLVICVLAMGAIGGVFRWQFQKPDVTLVLVAEDLSFRGGNPTLEIPPGSRVRLIVRNAAAGIKHDLTIDALDLQTPVLKPGEQTVLKFTAPETETALTYSCSLHPIMKGKLRIQETAE